MDRPQPQPADSLTDIGGHWAEKEIRTAVNAGIFHGVTETRFGPEVTMSRAMFVTGLYRVAGSPAPAAPSAFSDVSSGAWYADAVRWAGAENIVSGFGNGLFQPDGTLTREQIASFLYRDAQRRGLPMHQAGDLTSFQDGGQVSPWAHDAVAWAVGSGLISGKTGGLLAPSASATRAEAATMFCRYLSLLDRNPAN